MVKVWWIMRVLRVLWVLLFLGFVLGFSSVGFAQSGYSVPSYSFSRGSSYFYPVSRGWEGWGRVPNYDYGSGRFVSFSERAWLDRRAEAVFTGRGLGAPLWTRGLRLWVNSH